MLKLKITLNYKQPEPKTEQDKATFQTPRELTSGYINYAVNKKYPGGLKGISLRTFGRIQSKLDEAVLDKKDSIELETSEVDFIKETLLNDEIEFPSAISRYVLILIDEFEDAIAKEKAKNKEK